MENIVVIYPHLDGKLVKERYTRTNMGSLLSLA